jgi:hypothetical protein
MRARGRSRRAGTPPAIARACAVATGRSDERGVYDVSQTSPPSRASKKSWRAVSRSTTRIERQFLPVLVDEAAHQRQSNYFLRPAVQLRITVSAGRVG